MRHTKNQTLGEFVIQNQKHFPYSTGELSRLLSCLKIASKVVNRQVNKAGLANILGSSGADNIQGEEQQKLDVFAHQTFISALRSREVVCGVASEEEENYIPISSADPQLRKYIVLIDPLDGSSNIDVNVSIGTIFSIYRRISPPHHPVQEEDFLQPGDKQVAAGYIIYGSSTMMVFTTGHGVNGFTLDPSIGTYLLSHPNIICPSAGNIYSINEGGYNHFPQGVKSYIKHCQNPGPTERPYKARYIGSLVADFHRNMIQGGIYIYPSTADHPQGKLRLLYECNPMAFLAEQAGGRASDGRRRILEITPTTLHQRTPFFCGSWSMVQHAEKLMSRHSIP